MTTYKDKRGYARYEKEHTDLVHRNRAYHIYLQNRKKYPLPYSAYEVHHKDFNKNNNKVSNLQILTPSEHDKIHEEKQAKDELVTQKDFEEFIKIQENNKLAAKNILEKRSKIQEHDELVEKKVLEKLNQSNSKIEKVFLHPIGFHVSLYIICAYLFSIIVFRFFHLSSINKELNPFTYIFFIYQIPFALAVFIIVSVVLYVILISWWAEIVRRKYKNNRKNKKENAAREEALKEVNI